MQGVQRFVVFAFLVGGLLLWATLAKLLAALAYAVSAPDAPLLGPKFTTTTLVSLIFAAAAGIITFKNERAYNFCAEVIGELKKVTWPQKPEVQTSTVVVIVTTIILGVLLFLFDTGWGWATGVIYN